jgi:hypothetical protein
MGAFNDALETSEASLDTLDVIEDAHRQVASGNEKIVRLGSDRHEGLDQQPDRRRERDRQQCHRPGEHPDTYRL